MKYEVLKRSYVKRNIIIAIVIVLVLSAIILTFTRAKYRTTQSMPLLNGTINYTLADLNIVAMYLDGSEIDTLPDGNYELTSESYCTNEENVKDDSITLNYDGSTNTFTVAPFNKKGTKCYLYFDEKASGGDYILAGDNPPTNSTTDWTGGTSYYYTGNPNNWVQFGGFWWRIIRINGDGSIRMIYQGTSANTTGTGTQIGTSEFNSSYNKSYYVGLVYALNQHGSGQPSTIMNTLNTWYNNNLASYEEDYIDTGAGFCSDRNLQSGSWSATGSHEYAAYGRLYNNKGSESASLQCSDVDILSQDNGRLPNPIGLVTADEAVLTGIIWSSANTGSYLYTGENYWTMSPFHFNYAIASAGVFLVYFNGSLNNYYVNNTWGVRPVINLKANVTILSGDGSSLNPYKITE